MKLEGIYAILDYGYLRNEDLLTLANKLLDAGVSLFQYRDKLRDTVTVRSTAARLLHIIKKRKSRLIINDYPEIACDISADGYHLGQKDRIESEDTVLRACLISGRTVRSAEEGIQAEREGFDYISAGTVFPTETKTNGTLIGINSLKKIVESVSIPVFAIGGINDKNLDQVLAAGAAGAAMISGLFSTGDLKHTARNLISIFEHCR